MTALPQIAVLVKSAAYKNMEIENVEFMVALNNVHSQAYVILSEVTYPGPSPPKDPMIPDGCCNRAALASPSSICR